MEKFHRVFEEKFFEIQERSPAFSQRAFAKRLGLSSGAISEILNRKRKVSKKLAAALAEKMAFSPLEKRRAGLLDDGGEAEFRLSQDSFHLIADWWHYGILNLVSLKGAKSNSAWLAGRLGISVPKVEEAILRLERLGLLARDAKGKWKRTHARLNTVDNVKDLALQRSHRQTFELAANALQQVEVAARDFTSCTFPMNPAQMESLKALIRNFQDELMAEAGTGDPKEVYRLAIQLFPLTKEFNPRSQI